MAKNLMEFLIEDAGTETVEEVKISERLGDFKFKIRPLTGEEYTNAQKLCTIRRKRNKTDFDAKKFTEQIIIMGTIEPNFKDADAIKKAGVTTPEQLLYKVLRAGEISTLSSNILEVSGFNQDLDELEEEVKN